MKKHTFTLRTRPDDCVQCCDDCTVTVEIPGDASLYELAEFLLESMDFDLDHAFGFYDNVANMFRSKNSYTVFADMGDGNPGEKGVSDTPVDGVFSQGKQMILLFDYGDEWTFLVTCEKSEETKEKNIQPKLVGIDGKPPVQYPDWDDDDDENDEE
jgi:hypothetical protein